MSEILKHTIKKNHKKGEFIRLFMCTVLSIFSTGRGSEGVRGCMCERETERRVRE